MNTTPTYTWSKPVVTRFQTDLIGDTTEQMLRDANRTVEAGCMRTLADHVRSCSPCTHTVYKRYWIDNFYNASYSLHISDSSEGMPVEDAIDLLELRGLSLDVVAKVMENGSTLATAREVAKAVQL